ncbi:MAG: hypothetical protein ACTHK7_14805, partial [Aureliella sp.]
MAAAVRAVEFDQTTSANIAGPWSHLSFVYEDQTDEPPKTSELVFDAGDVASAVLPSLEGQVSFQHGVAGLRVDVDIDGDGNADYKATTDSYGQFVIRFDNLPDNTASIDVRTVATNPATKLVQEEAWQTLAVNYVIATPAAASIVDMALVEDTGTSSTDRVTTKPKIKGGVSRGPTGRLMVVEVDTNGDQVADGVTLVGANLQWAYSPTGLSIGSVTVAARTRDTAVNGQTTLGAWSSFTFTLQSGVDSNGSTDEQDQQGAIGDAENQAGQDQNAADADLSDAIITANQDQAASVSAADAQFDQDVAQAAADFAQAQAAAAANYQAALAAFTGNASNFDFQPLQWPDSPQFQRLTIPDDGTQPKPPRSQPDYSGPNFDFNSNGAYLAASNFANTTYRNAVSNAESNRRSQDKAAQQAYQDALKAERDRAKDATEDAYDDYHDALEVPASTDLAAAHETYNTSIQGAWDGYRTSVDSADEARRSAMESASNTAQSSYQSAWNAFKSEADSAWSDLLSVLNSDPPPSEDARKSAWNAYSSRMLSAGKTRDQADADTSHAFTDAAITANTTWYKALADAQQKLSLDQNAAAETYEGAVAAHDNELRSKKIAATITLEKALATIKRDSAKANADAARDRDKKLATNARTEQLAIEQAKANLWVAEASAKKTALIAWNSAVGSPWTAYQLDLANNELSYYQSLQTAHNTRTQAVADAEKIRADAVADARNKSARDRADEQYKLDTGYSDAKSTYWTNSATKLNDATTDSIDERKTIRDKLANIAHARAHQSADDGATYARAINDAGHDYATTMISSRTLNGVPAATAIGAGTTLT